MTIFDAAPAIFGLVIAIGGYVYARVTHDRAVAARDARRARERIATE